VIGEPQSVKQVVMWRQRDKTCSYVQDHKDKVVAAKTRCYENRSKAWDETAHRSLAVPRPFACLLHVANAPAATAVVITPVAQSCLRTDVTTTLCSSSSSDVMLSSSAKMFILFACSAECWLHVGSDRR